MISEKTKKEIRSNISKNDAAKRSNARLVEMIRKDYGLGDKPASQRKLAEIRKELIPIVAECYGCTVENGRQGEKFEGKKKATARTTLGRLLSYFKAPKKPDTPFQKAVNAVKAAIEAGMTEEEAKVIISLVE